MLSLLPLGGVVRVFISMLSGWAISIFATNTTSAYSLMFSLCKVIVIVVVDGFVMVPAGR